MLRLQVVVLVLALPLRSRQILLSLITILLQRLRLLLTLSQPSLKVSPLVLSARPHLRQLLGERLVLLGRLRIRRLGLLRPAKVGLGAGLCVSDLLVEFQLEHGFFLLGGLKFVA